jgi:hypothetical protein
MAGIRAPEQTPGGSTLGEWPIHAYPYPDGYVPANSVGDQSSVGLC